MWGVLGRTIATALFLGMWLGLVFEVGPLQDAPIAVYILLSTMYGYVVRRWWAPPIIFCLVPIISVPQAYGDSQPDYANGVVVVLGGMAVVALVVVVGVLLARLTGWLSARGTSSST